MAIFSFQPDPGFIPYDIALIDRELMQKGVWENFVAWQKELYEHGQQDDLILVLLDNHGENGNIIPFRMTQFNTDLNSDYETLFSFIYRGFI